MKYQSNNQTIGGVSKLQRLWESGGFAITAQVPSCLTAEARDFWVQVAAQANLLDAVLTADAPDGAVAVSSLATAVLLKRVGIEPIIQFSGRDRNRLALQSDILGLGVLDIPNLLIDMRPVLRASLVQNADARLVTDLDGPALLAAAVRMRDEGRFISGASIKTPPVLYIGALCSLEEQIWASSLSSAQFVVTRPVYDVPGFTAALAAFQFAHPDLLPSRPLLVSLPLIRDARVESSAGNAGIQQVGSSIELLKGLDGIRGFNIVLVEKTDLALVEQILRRSNLNTVGRG